MSEWKRISTLADVRRGASPRPIGDPRYFGGNVGWVRISDVTRSARFLRETEQYVSPLGESLSVRVNPGDLVMSICGTLGRPIVIDIPACIHDGFVQFSNLRNVDPLYLFYALQFSEPKFNGMGQPGTQTNLNTSLVGRMEIFAPPIDHQRRIAEILTTLDEEIEATEELVAKQQQIKAGLMHDLFTRGLWTQPELDRGDHKGLPSEASAKAGTLRPAPEEAPQIYQDSPLGMIPKEWIAQPLRFFVPNVRYGVSVNMDEDRSGVPVLRMNNLGNGRIDVSDIKYSRSLEARGLLLRNGDVVFNRTNSLEHVGKSAIWRCELEVASFASYLVRLDVDQNVMIPEFLNHWLNLPCTQQAIRRYATPGVHQVNINPTSLRQVFCAAPTSLDEQRLVYEPISNIDIFLLTTQEYLAKLRHQKQGLMHDLLTGRVRVDEPASPCQVAVKSA